MQTPPMARRRNSWLQTGDVRGAACGETKFVRGAGGPALLLEIFDGM
jgi:hypothetical protein